jgi:hypothetical protein
MEKEYAAKGKGRQVTVSCKSCGEHVSIEFMHPTTPPKRPRGPFNILMWEQHSVKWFRPKCQLCNRRAGEQESGFSVLVQINVVGQFHICEVCVVKLDGVLGV